MAKLVGKITHYYDNIGVGVIKLSEKLHTGDKIKIGDDEPYEQEVLSLQINHQSVNEAGPEDSVGIKLEKETKEGAKVYLAE